MSFNFLASAQFTDSKQVRLYLKSNSKIIGEYGTQLSPYKGIRATKVRDKYLIFSEQSSVYDFYKINKNNIHEENSIYKALSPETSVSIFKREALNTIKKINFSQKQSCLKTQRALDEESLSSLSQYQDCSLYMKLTSPLFNKLLISTRNKLKIFLSQDDIVNKLESKLDRYSQFLSSLKDLKLPVLMNKLGKVIFSIYDPIQKNQSPLSQQTLFVPINNQWINSRNSISQWFSEEWIDIQYPFMGNTGEGISRRYNEVEFNEIIQTFLKLNLSFPEYSNDNEMQWLTSFSRLEHDNLQNLIFLHPDSEKSNNSVWKGYIPTEQSLGSFPSLTPLSILIHELNVNSETYFPRDTHIEELRSSDNFDGSNFKQVSAYTGRNSFIELIYLAIILDT